MTKTHTVPGAVLTLLFVSGLAFVPAFAGELSKYRDFQFGTDLPTVAKLVGRSPDQAKVIHSRPVLIQELEWRPQRLGVLSKAEPAQDVVFSFYNGELFRILVHYDRYETEGLTPDDLVEAISTIYGTASKPPVVAKPTQAPYDDLEELLAQWQDSEYRFDLIRSSYGPSFRLNGVRKRLEAASQAAILEAKRLDDKEAPQREAARIASQEESARANLEKARLVNKPKFRP